MGIFEDFGSSSVQEELTEEEAYIQFEERRLAYAFFRVCKRKRRLKVKLDCGHTIDGSEPYRYSVWRTNDMPPGTIEQRTDCEFCARRFDRY